MDPRHKQLRDRAGRAAGPPTPSGYGILTHLPTPKSLMNAKILAEIYLNYTREHENAVNKMICINIHKGLERHAVKSYFFNFFTQEDN